MELQRIMPAMRIERTGSIHVMCVNRIAAPPTITAAVESVSPSMCRKTLRMFTSPEKRESSVATVPFIRTPAAATIIISFGWTATGALMRWIAAMAIHADSTTRVRALTNAASTPARW